MSVEGFWWISLSSSAHVPIYSPSDLRTRVIFLTLAPTLVIIVSNIFSNPIFEKHILVVFSSICVTTNEIYHF